MSLTKKEKHTISTVASDLVSGRYLITVITDDEKNMLREFADLFKSVKLGIKLTGREIDLIQCLSGQFYGGMEDMCEQICIDYKKLKDALDESD
jgi:hypothetical protein